MYHTARRSAATGRAPRAIHVRVTSARARSSSGERGCATTLQRPRGLPAAPRALYSGWSRCLCGARAARTDALRMADEADLFQPGAAADAAHRPGRWRQPADAPTFACGLIACRAHVYYSILARRVLAVCTKHTSAVVYCLGSRASALFRVLRECIEACLCTVFACGACVTLCVWRVLALCSVRRRETDGVCVLAC